MNAVRRQHGPTVFGPFSSPLYYTMLSQAPQRLIVAGLSGDSLCSIVLTVTGPATRSEWVLRSRPINGVCIWPLAVLPIQADLVCAWQIEENECSSADSRAQNHMASAASLREGSFRLLDAVCRDRLSRGQERLERVQDPYLGSMAGALFMAELGLYHEALALMTSYLKNETGRSNLLLARTAQTLIYKQMLRQIEREHHGHAADSARLGRYLTWTRNRERYHREMAVAMMKGQCPRRCLHEVATPCK